VVSGGLFDSRGRIIGSSVYMVICGDSKCIRIKIGFSDRPLKRLQAILVSCPFQPEVFATINLPSRYLANRLEKALHVELKKWRSHGEWFEFEQGDKRAFNDSCRLVLADFSSSSWKLKWRKINVPEFIASRRKRSAYVQSLRAKRGKAYRDFSQLN
jgi:hypothetical protein